MLEARRVSLIYPTNGIHALQNADFRLSGGEIHAIVGENGAGKTTLAAALAGFITPNDGNVTIDGIRMRFFGAADGMKHGVGMAKQHPALVAGFKVWEECILGSSQRHDARLDARPAPFLSLFSYSMNAAREKLENVSREYGISLPLDTATEALSQSERYFCRILTLIFRRQKYYLFDEPTAAMTRAETALFWSIAARLKSQGCGVAVISHKLDETLPLADRVTVLRGGITVLSAARRDASRATVFHAMFGSSPRSVDEGNGARRARVRRAQNIRRSLALSVEGLSVEHAGFSPVRNVLLSIEKGEIVGLAGVKESGRDTLQLAIAGFAPLSSGKITLNDKTLASHSVRSFRAAGGVWITALAEIPEAGERPYAPHLSIIDNLAIHIVEHSARGRLGLVNRRAARALTMRVLAAAGLEGRGKDEARAFSGGQLSRLLFWREFLEGGAFLLVGEAMPALDTRTKEELRAHLHEAAEAGKGILVSSADSDDLYDLCDRVLVMYDGRVVREIRLDDDALSREDYRESVNRAIAGEEAEAPTE